MEELLFANCGLELRRFTRAENRAGRTPDYRVLKAGAIAAYCEVKSPRDDGLVEQIEQAPPGELAGGLRADPVFNRLARHISKAASQFDAVNADRAMPNVLAFVNHDDASDYADLRETVTGMLSAADGARYPTMLNIAEGRLGQVKQCIDLYAWIDVPTQRVQGYVFNKGAPHHVETLCDLLGLDRSPIKR